MRVLVSGDRHYGDSKMMRSVLYGIHHLHPDLVIIEGEAPGADTMAREIGEELGVEVEKYPAAWDEHDYEGTSGIKCTHARLQPTYCPAAGVRRNAQMLDEGLPNVVLCFHDNFESSRGTKDMSKRAKYIGLPTYLITRL